MLFYANVNTLDWQVEVFGLTVRMRHVAPDGRIAHAELAFGDGLIMVIAPSQTDGSAAPAALGGTTTQGRYVMIDDADQHYVACPRTQRQDPR